MKWNDYQGNEVFFINQERTKMYLVEEGSGDNLLDEDIDEGYVDYWLTSTYDLKANKVVEEQAMWMETETIYEHDYTFEELIERMKECDAPHDLERWEILPYEEGMEIRDRLEAAEYEVWKAQVEEAKERLRSGSAM